MKQYSRHKARKLAIQAIYQWHMTKNETHNIISFLQATANPRKVDFQFFSEIVVGVINNIGIIDATITDSSVSRKITELNIVELSILRLAIYELMYRPEIPYKVVINEAIELTKIFGSLEGAKFVNGALDKLSKKIRNKIEIGYTEAAISETVMS